MGAPLGMTGPERGRLGPHAAPTAGERIEVLFDGRARVEHIVTGHLDEVQSYLSDRDEWVIVLDGAAVLEVDEVTGTSTVELSAGDWVVLPTGTPHRLVSAQPGTRWLAVHDGKATLS